jgi:hypothetical protein
MCRPSYEARIIKLLVERDNINTQDAAEIVDAFKDDLQEMLDDGGNAFEQMNEIEELGYDHFGLEPDYTEEFIFALV